MENLKKTVFVISLFALSLISCDDSKKETLANANDVVVENTKIEKNEIDPQSALAKYSFIPITLTMDIDDDIKPFGIKGEKYKFWMNKANSFKFQKIKFGDTVNILNNYPATNSRVPQPNTYINNSSSESFFATIPGLHLVYPKGLCGDNKNKFIANGAFEMFLIEQKSASFAKGYEEIQLIQSEFFTKKNNSVLEFNTVNFAKKNPDQIVFNKSVKGFTHKTKNTKIRIFLANAGPFKNANYSISDSTTNIDFNVINQTNFNSANKMKNLVLKVGETAIIEFEGSARNYTLTSSLGPKAIITINN